MSAAATAPATVIRDHAISLSAKDWPAELLAAIGKRRIVLLGESTHGTHEFYALRAAITRRLISEHGFHAVAVEADWPHALQVSRYLQAGSGELDAALSGFTRFPLWMWRNREMAQLFGWLRQHNSALPAERRIGFYGLDLYSLQESMAAVVTYLEEVDPAAALTARQRYGCLDRFADDPRRYGYATRFDLGGSCEAAVIQQLTTMHHHRTGLFAHDGVAAHDEAFYAEQNARLVSNAERYYRSLFELGEVTWNLRDTHMADTLQALDQHLTHRVGEPARIVVWAHNSHIGDARATEMGEQGQLNLGQLVRERWGESRAFLLGFTTCEGEVIAASEWDQPAECKQLQPGLPGSYEALFHEVAQLPGAQPFGAFLLPLEQSPPELTAALRRRLERAVGVIYLPRSERISHYFEAELTRQFDALIHIERSHALTPLDGAVGARAEPPETFPYGF